MERVEGKCEVDRPVPGVYPTIQAGIDDANDGDTVTVAQGTYYENIDFGGKSITLRSSDPNDPNVAAATVIDANGSGTVVTFPDNASAVCVLAGFTITNGNSSGNGGGILCSNGAIDINNCIITSNSAAGNGGGIAVGGIASEYAYADLTLAGCTFSQNTAYDGSTPFSGGGGIFTHWGRLTLTDCQFTDNDAVNRSGGGIRSPRGELTLTNCTFNSNSAAVEGGGIATDYNSVILTNCTFTGNSAAGRGGGMNNTHWGATAANCVFSDNSADYGGGICTKNLYRGDTTLRLSNCTFSKNEADRYGGAVANLHDGNLILTNCILWDNIAFEEGPQIAMEEEGSVSVSYSCLQGYEQDVYIGAGVTLDWGHGNIDRDPCFADGADDDYHLRSAAGRWDPNQNTWVIDGESSLCIDAGNPGCPPANEPPPNGNRINMGAYGGTAEASKSPPDWAALADLTNDRAVDYKDLWVFVDYWLEDGLCIPADLSHNQSADFLDFALFADKWRWEE
jgi:predicted outer membrane repeat protein